MIYEPRPPKIETVTITTRCPDCGEDVEWGGRMDVLGLGTTYVQTECSCQPVGDVAA